MKLSKLMSEDVVICRTFESVESIAETMKNENIGFLPVCDDRGAAVGTITDRDLAIRVLGEHKNPLETVARDVMTKEVVCCTEDDDVETVESLMAEAHVSRIVIIDDDRCPIGVISLSDIAQVRGKKAVDVLADVSAREARNEDIENRKH
jgi:CBS domain-containing protein